jgi:hypothetical protein
VRNHLKRILSLMLVVLCMTSFSITAFASGGEAVTESETENATDNDTPSKDETAEDMEEILYSYSINEDGSVVITLNGAVT